MQRRRRFELKKGNKEQFWEIWRVHGIITTRYGNIGQEDQAEEKDKDCKSYREAEVEFDRLIRARIQKGFEETQGQSEVSQINDKREVYLITPKNEYGLYLTTDEFHKIFNWMVEPLFLVDKRIEIPDLDKWTKRALRICRLRDIPEDEEDFQKFISTLREITQNDRSKTRDPNVIPGYKFTDNQYWIVNPDEAELIYNKASIKLKKSINARTSKGKLVTQKQILYTRWLDYNQLSISNGGYEVRSISHRFESVQGKFSLGLDDWSYESLLNWLLELEIIDQDEDESPEDIVEEILTKQDKIHQERKDAKVRLSKADNNPALKKFQAFRKKFFKETLSLRSPNLSVGTISLFKLIDCEYFWVCNKAECDIIIEAIEESIENGNRLNSLQQNFYDFIINARTNKGFSLSSIEREEELTEQFMDDYEEYSEEEYDDEEYEEYEDENEEEYEEEG